MSLLVGTSRGIFDISNPTPQLRCDCRAVRDIVRISGNLYAGARDGLYQSADEGENWARCGLDGLEVWQIRSDGHGKIYASTQPAGLWYTTNVDSPDRSWHAVESFANFPGAQQWCVPVKPVQPAQARALVIDQSNPARMWVGVEVGGIMTSQDQSETWSLNLPGNNPDIHMMFAHPANPDILFVSTGYGRLDGIAEMIEGNAGVFRSDNGGQSWTYIWHGITPRYSRPMCIDHRAPYALTVAAAPTAFASHKEVGGAGACLFQSIDEGVNWYQLGDAQHSPSAVNFHGLGVDNSQPGAVLVGTDNGEVWRVSSPGQWQRVCHELPWVLSIFDTL